MQFEPTYYLLGNVAGANVAGSLRTTIMIVWHCYFKILKYVQKISCPIVERGCLGDIRCKVPW